MTNRCDMPSAVVAEDDAFWLKVETPSVPSRWAMALELTPRSQGERLTIERLRAHVAERLPGLPWLCHRVHSRWKRGGRYHWLATSPMPLAELVVQESGVSADRVERYIERIIMMPLDRRLPLWRLRLVELADGRQHIVFDGHHAFGGGFVVLEILDGLFGDMREPVTAAKLPTRPSFGDDAIDAAWKVASLARRLALRLRPGAAWERARVGEPLVGPIGPRRRVATRRLRADQINRIASAHGASVTRVLLALTARALDDVAGREVSTLRALFPRAQEDHRVTGPGNHSRSSFLELPLHLPAPERIAAVKDAIARSAAIEQQRPAVVDLTLSMLPPTAALTIAEHDVTSMVTAAPLRVCTQPYTRLTLVLQQYRDNIIATFTVDADGVGDTVDAIADSLVAAADEYAAAAAG